MNKRCLKIVIALLRFIKVLAKQMCMFFNSVRTGGLFSATNISLTFKTFFLTL